jgi:mRNA interferase RelE/StbE
VIVFEVRFTPEAAASVSNLHPDNKKLIKAALDNVRRAPFSVHELQEELSGFRSYRSKRYRIVYKVDEEARTIEVYHVGNRGDVYEEFRRLLNQFKD